MSSISVVEWSRQTFYFYMLIPIISLLVPKLTIASGNNSVNTKKIPVGGYIVAFLLICIKCFSYTGRDVRIGYLLDFLSADSFSSFRDPSIEVGFRLLYILVYNLTHNYYIFLFIVGFITVFPIVYYIFKYSNKLNTGITFFLYACMYLMPGFSLIRMYMASSIALCSFDAILENKKKKAAIWFILALLIHRSMVVLLLVYALYFFRKVDKRLLFLGTMVLVYLVISKKDFILGMFSGRYSQYGSENVVHGLGSAIFIEYIPLLLLFWYASSFIDKERVRAMGYSILLGGFFWGLVSYYITVLGRAQAAFLPIIYIVGYSTKIINKNKPVAGKVIEALVVIFGLLQLVTYLTGYFNLDDIMPYTSYLGFNI